MVVHDGVPFIYLDKIQTVLILLSFHLMQVH